MPEPVVDVHNHLFPGELLDAFRRGQFDGFVLAEGSDGPELTIGGQRFGSMESQRTDLGSRLAAMDAMGVDVQALSLLPPLLGYQLPADQGIRLCQIVDEAIARTAAAHPRRFVGLATVPLQDPAAAAAELRRAVGQLGLKGVQIGANVAGANLGEPQLFPFWEAVADLDCFVLVHPNWANIPAIERMNGYHLRNVIGNPLDTSLAIASLIFGGHLERWPGLKICFVHAGGFVPYQIGRFDHAYRVRPEARRAIPSPPSTYFRRLYFDTISHDGDALAYLVAKAGSGQVLLGTDYPADMADPDPLATIGGLRLDPAARAAVRGGTAAGLLKLESLAQLL